VERRKRRYVGEGAVNWLHREGVEVDDSLGGGGRGRRLLGKRHRVGMEGVRRGWTAGREGRGWAGQGLGLNLGHGLREAMLGVGEDEIGEGRRRMVEKGRLCVRTISWTPPGSPPSTQSQGRYSILRTELPSSGYKPGGIVRQNQRIPKRGRNRKASCDTLIEEQGDPVTAQWNSLKLEFHAPPCDPL